MLRKQKTKVYESLFSKEQETKATFAQKSLARYEESEIKIIGSEFGFTIMKAWIHSTLYQNFRLIVVVYWYG